MQDRFRKKLAELISKKLKARDYNQVSLNYVGSGAVLETLEETKEPMKEEEAKEG